MGTARAERANEMQRPREDLFGRVCPKPDRQTIRLPDSLRRQHGLLQQDRLLGLRRQTILRPAKAIRKGPCGAMTAKTRMVAAMRV